MTPNNKILTGKQTEITPEVRKIADTLVGRDVKLVNVISDYIKSMDFVKGSAKPDFSRKADEILKSSKINGCNETGVVFAAILRAKGIATTYIQALNKNAVFNFSPDHPSLNGHVFLETHLPDIGKGNTIIINPTSGDITECLPEEMIEGARGLDAWDIGLKEGSEQLKDLFEKKHRELINKR